MKDPPFSLYLSQSQSGKSEILCDLASSWRPFWSTRAVKEVVYVGNHATPAYLGRLREVGRRLGIPVHICVEQGGIHSPKFKRNWDRRISRGRDDIADEDRPLAEAENRDELEDDDDDDDEDDDEATPSKRKKGNKKDNDACADFIARMVRQHCARPNAAPAARSYAKNVIGNDAAVDAGSRKRRSTSVNLAQRPKLGNIRKARSFLTLRDKPLQNLGFLAVAPQRSLVNAPTGVVGSGAATTRSKTRRSKEVETAVSAPDAAERPLAMEKSQRRRRNNNNDNVNNNNNNNNNNKDDEETPLTEELERNLNSKLEEKEAEEVIPFVRDTLILLDDALTPLDPIKDGGVNAARADRENYLATLQWIMKLCLEESHHMGLHLAVTSQV